ncbi:hypothetical protein BB561_004824, partial [Smittium simulii]
AIKKKPYNKSFLDITEVDFGSDLYCSSSLPSVSNMGTDHAQKDSVRVINMELVNQLAVDSAKLTELYSELKQKTIKSIKKNKKKQYLKNIEETSQDFISNKSKKLWSWIKNRIGRGFASISNGPVLDTDGNLIIEQNQKLLVWAKHFEGLAEDSTGNSRVITKWQNIWEPSRDTLPECNDSITWEEIKIALKATPKTKQLE